MWRQSHKAPQKRFLIFYMLYHPEDKVGFLSRKMLIFPRYYYWNRWNVWVSNSVLFGRYFVPITSLKALDHWRVLDCTRLGLCQSCSLLYNHLLADDKSMGSIVYLFLKRVNECFWYPCMTFILAFLILWLEVLPSFSDIRNLSWCTWFQVTTKPFEKECKYLSTNAFFMLPEMGQFPFNMHLKMKRWKLVAFLYFENFIAFFVRTGALRGPMRAKAARPRVLLVYHWAAQRPILVKVNISIMEHI